MSERAERQDAQRRVEQLSGQVGFWQGRAEAFRAHVMMLGSEQEADDEVIDHNVSRSPEVVPGASEGGEVEDQTLEGEAGQDG